MRKRAELFGVENTDEFKQLVTQNLAKVYYSLQKRAAFLELCKNVLVQKAIMTDVCIDAAGEIIDEITTKMQPAIQEAEQDFVTLALYVAQRLGIEESELDLDVSVGLYDDKKFASLRGKAFKETVKSAVLEIGAASRKAVKEAQSIFEARKLKNNIETEEAYYKSLNFKYICDVNTIYGKASGYGKIAEDTINFVLSLKEEHEEKE